MKPKKVLKDGVSCGHKGCLLHFKHPCEYCGRITGRNKSSINIETVKVEGFAERYNLRP